MPYSRNFYLCHMLVQVCISPSIIRNTEKDYMSTVSPEIMTDFHCFALLLFLFFHTQTGKWPDYTICPRMLTAGSFPVTVTAGGFTETQRTQSVQIAHILPACIKVFPHWY